ncbi:hypothetical protein Acr_26g0008540 [Actinidia rufa]|uniref:Uncharacterized protein n=1 Tax=Actinidia rufa TaxID=165716 RepID=A0A7J0H4A1_9ERIC|nr:hypothetical protein Acr_06g0005940 [Actinidia rufa]GFZ06433.1 hypothetical protein Acr_18g0006030 [Actinidia rufa]GFZ17584.1 hypothetical protein Acr_26g0008540 [Actinidia rufa]
MQTAMFIECSSSDLNLSIWGIKIHVLEIWIRFMKRFHWFKQISSNGKLERRLSLGEYKRAISWSKYLVSSGD